MAEPKYTPEIINKALESDERLQYLSLVDLLLNRKVLTVQQQSKYDAYKAKLDKCLKGGEKGMEEENRLKSDEVGIPASLRVRRRYTMSEAALEQRRNATRSPNKAIGMEGNRNGWKHGHFTQNFINKIKPCKSTCPQYPCELVNEGETEPGEDCLDKVEVIQFYRAVHTAISKKDYEQFNDLAALQISNTIKVIDMLIEDIIRDGTVVKREKRDGKDNTIIEYVTHPSLLALPKLLADLGLSPAEFLITPRSLKRVESDEETGKTLAEMLSRAGRAIKKKQAPVDEE